VATSFVLLLGLFIFGAIINPAFIAVVAAGFVLGLVNGFGVSYLGIAPLIMTFAWYLVIMGIMLIVTKGRIIGESSPFLSLLGQGKYLGAVVGSIFLVTLTSILRTMQMDDGCSSCTRAKRNNKGEDYGK
jgi:ribose/xylose/arabinose/galactoside ABC-type transport system permease subunit